MRNIFWCSLFFKVFWSFVKANHHQHSAAANELKLYFIFNQSTIVCFEYIFSFIYEITKLILDLAFSSPHAIVHIALGCLRVLCEFWIKGEFREIFFLLKFFLFFFLASKLKFTLTLIQFSLYSPSPFTEEFKTRQSKEQKRNNFAARPW